MMNEIFLLTIQFLPLCSQQKSFKREISMGASKWLATAIVAHIARPISFSFGQ
jgi:hypothetical protein